MEPTGEEILFFDRYSGALPIYLGVRARILAALPESRIAVQKTQISFRNRRLYACAWLPVRWRVENRPRDYVMLSFFLPYRVESPRVERAVEPYPNRWSHHLLISKAAQIDEEAISWLRESYAFAQR